MIEEIATTDAYASDNANSQAIRYGDTVYVSGQVPKDPETGTVVGNDIKTQTQQVFNNIGAVLEEAGTGIDNLVKTRVYLREREDYTAFNKVYRECVSEPFPARSTVEVGDLMIDAKIEIEATAAMDG